MSPKPQSKPAKDEAENFHVLPKQQATTPLARTAEADPHAARERDAEAGSVVGTSEVDGHPSRAPMSERSQVS